MPHRSLLTDLVGILEAQLEAARLEHFQLTHPQTSLPPPWQALRFDASTSDAPATRYPTPPLQKTKTQAQDPTPTESPRTAATLNPFSTPDSASAPRPYRTVFRFDALKEDALHAKMLAREAEYTSAPSKLPFVGGQDYRDSGPSSPPASPKQTPPQLAPTNPAENHHQSFTSLNDFSPTSNRSSTLYSPPNSPFFSDRRYSFSLSPVEPVGDDPHPYPLSFDLNQYQTQQTPYDDGYGSISEFGSMFAGGASGLPHPRPSELDYGSYVDQVGDHNKRGREY